MGFDNYCKAALHGVTHVVRNIREHVPGATYDDIFGVFPRWFDNEEEAQFVCDKLNEDQPFEDIFYGPAAPYWVEDCDIRIL